MRNVLRSWIVVLAVAVSAPAPAAEANYIQPSRLDLTKLLPPPPAPTSEQHARDLTEVLAVQNSRTTVQVEGALADATSGTFGFRDVLGQNFTAERLPTVAGLFEKVRRDANNAFTAGKGAWDRKRPFDASPEVQPLGERPASSSYPSGGSTQAYLTAILLANMVPEKSVDLFARGRQFGASRVILGVHFPSDVEAGRIAATAIATALMQDEIFMRDFMAARTELRKGLGLASQ